MFDKMFEKINLICTGIKINNFPSYDVVILILTIIFKVSDLYIQLFNSDIYSLVYRQLNIFNEINWGISREVFRTSSR